MARIRNIKPEFFRHEALQDLEAAHPGAYIMLTYVALWTQCDKNGVFAWKPRTMRLDILPFLQINIEQNLQILLEAGYIQTFENQGEKYGFVPAFGKHQILSTKEKIAPAKYPTPPNTKSEQSQHSTGTPDIGHRTYDIGRGRADNAPAHEEENFEKQKTETPPHPEPPNARETDTPPHDAGQPLADPFSDAIHAINEWGKQNDWQNLRDYVQTVRYDPETYGPVRDEIFKFTAHWLDPKRHPADRVAFQADPARFFQEKGRKWLLDAKNMNKPPKNRDKPPNGKPRQPYQKRTGPITIADSITQSLNHSITQ